MLLVGTGNAHKLEEIRRILADWPVPVVGTEILPPGDEPEESGATFAANARIKARAFALRAAHLPPEARPRWVIADDSGLCVDALDGAPGVRSARYAGEGCTFADNNRKLLAALAQVPTPQRTAHFHCTVACVSVPSRVDDEPELLFECVGECPGSIAREPSGAGGFGYDPVFIERSTGRTFADLPADEKNSLSHRGRALAELARRFRELPPS